MTDDKELFDETQEEDGDEEFAEYAAKSEFSKPLIAQSAVQKCLEARGVELKEGFFNYKTDNSGNVVKTWIADSRKVYCSTVTALYFLMSPEIRKTKNGFTKSLKEIEEEEKALMKTYSYTEMKQERSEGRIKIVPTDRKYIPEYDAIVIVKDVSQNNIAIKVKGGWNQLISAYWNEMVELSDKRFALLNDLIDYLNYFKERTSY